MSSAPLGGTALDGADRSGAGLDGSGGGYLRSFSACGHPGIAELTKIPSGSGQRGASGRARVAAAAGCSPQVQREPSADSHSAGRVMLRLHLPTYDSIIDAVARARAMLGTDADPTPAVATLVGDRLLRPLVEASPGLRVPRAWDRFETAVRIVVGQQISLAAASTLCGRVAARFGEPIDPVLECCDDVPVPLTHLFPGAARLAAAGPAEFEGLGFTARRVDTIVGLARAVADGEIDLHAVDTLERTVARLCELDGIGPWTAHLVAMRVHGHDDAFPASDLGLRRAAGRLMGRTLSARELDAVAERWRPYRAWAAQHLWNSAARCDTDPQR